MCAWEFAQGLIVKATANTYEQLNQILDTDEGARYIGEFALGVNPHITKPMGDILFDEKISGSFHFTPGNAYENTGQRQSVPLFIGIWCACRRRRTAAERFGLMAAWCAKTGCSF